MPLPESREDWIVREARKRPPAERAAFLDGACAGQEILRQRIEALLGPQEQGDSQAVTAPDWERPTIIEDSQADVPDEAIGQTLGHYKLLEKIGEGGFGAVYVAEQKEPVKRRVALKIIKLGMDTRQVVARFEAERQALALMDHPSIAKVLDAGSTKSGRPYFVMELVRGIRITDYCDQERLSTEDRLEVFIKVCQAIQHAHQKGVIHRDIKPSNILVALQDGTPTPKVIDFGIAKATQQGLTEKTIYTQLQQFIGTPAYMSPEQAEMSGLDVDTRSDIYSLGVLLYELLTGRTPFDAKELIELGLEGMRKTIREKEPVQPSTWLHTLSGGELTTRAKRHGVEASKLVSQLRGDLDWIVMKCLEKDRARRYDTANGLATDLRHHLNNEPVLARPASAAYRFQKAFRRNKLAFTAATVVVVALVVGLGLAAVGLRNALKERNAALAARAGEEAQRREAQKAQANEAELRRRAQTEELIARRRAYAADMNLVQQALAMNNLGRAQMLLNGQIPKPGKVDLRGWEWRYLWSQARADEHRVFFSGTYELARLSFSADGRLLAREANGEIVVADVPSSRPVFTQTGASHAEFAHHASLLAFARNVKERGFEVVLWDFSTQREVLRLPFSRSAVEWILFTPDDQQLLTVSVRSNEARQDNQPLHLTAWTLTAGTQLWQQPLPALRIGDGRQFTVSPDGTAIAIALEGGRLQVRELKDGSERFTKEATQQSVRALAFSPDGSTLISGAGYTDSTIRLWDAHDGKPLGSLDGHRSWISDLLFAQDGKQLVSASGDQTIRLWDWPTHKPAGVLRGHLSEVQGIAISPTGRTLASGCKDGSIYLWDLDHLAERPAYHTLPIKGSLAVFTPDSRSMVVLERGGGLAQWDVQSLRVTKQWRYSTTNYQGNGTISADAAQAALFNRNGDLSILDLASGNEQTNVLGNHELFDNCWFANRGTLMVTAVIDRERNVIHARVWDTKNWRAAGRFEFNFRAGNLYGIQPSPTRSLCFNQNGQNLLVWDLSTPEAAPRRLPGGSGREEYWGAEVSPDGHTVAAAYGDGFVRLWNLETQQPLDTLRGFLLGVHSVAFSPDGHRLAAGSNSLEAIKLWDSASWQEVLTLGAEDDLFLQAGFSPDGRTLMARNAHRLVHVWSAPTWEEIAAAEAKEKTNNKQP